VADNVKIKIEVDAKQGITEVNELKKSINETTNIAAGSKSKFGSFGSALSSLGGPIGSAIQGLKAMGKELWALVANPIVAIVAAIVLAFMGLWKILKSFQPVFDLMEQGMAALEAVFQVIKNTIFALVTGAKNLREAFSGLGGRMKQAAVEAANLKKAIQDLEDTTKETEVSNAKLQTSINELILQSKDRTKTEEERIALMDEAMRLEEEQFNQSKSLNDQEVANAEKAIEIKAELTDEELALLQEKGVEYANYLADSGRLTDEEIDKLKEALLKREDINQQHIALSEKTQNRINQAQDDAAAKETKRQDDWKKKQEEKLAADKAYKDMLLTQEQGYQKDLQDYINDLNKKTDELPEPEEPNYDPNSDPETIKLQEKLTYESDLWIESQMQTNEGLQKLYDLGLIDYKTYTDGQIELEKKAKEKKIAIAQAVFAGATKIMSSLGAFYDAQMNKELEAAGDNEEEKDKIRKKYAEKKKHMAYIQAIIDTASAVMQALASMPPPISYIMAAVSAAAGAIEIATISKQQFAKGGILNGPAHANGGILTPYGEVEGGESIINKNSMSSPNLRNLASAVNVAGGGNNFGTGDGSINLNPSTIQLIADAINNKKVYVVESDITETQKKVKVMENAAVL